MLDPARAMRPSRPLWLFLSRLPPRRGRGAARGGRRHDVRDDWNRLVRFNERLKVLEATGGPRRVPARIECAALARALDEFLDPPHEDLTLAMLVDRFDPQGHPWGVGADAARAAAGPWPRPRAAGRPRAPGAHEVDRARLGQRRPRLPRRRRAACSWPRSRCAPPRAGMLQRLAARRGRGEPLVPRGARGRALHGGRRDGPGARTGCGGSPREWRRILGLRS